MKRGTMTENEDSNPCPRATLAFSNRTVSPGKARRDVVSIEDLVVLR
jgi:hypothetical protein